MGKGSAMKKFWVRGLIGCLIIAAAVVVGRYAIGDDEEGDGPGDCTNMVADSSWGDDGDQNDQGDDEGDSVEVVFGDESGTPFPDGLNPMALLNLSISDSNGVVVLSGDFMNLSVTE